MCRRLMQLVPFQAPTQASRALTPTPPAPPVTAGPLVPYAAPPLLLPSDHRSATGPSARSTSGARISPSGSRSSSHDYYTPYTPESYAPSYYEPSGPVTNTHTDPSFNAPTTINLNLSGADLGSYTDIVIG